MPKKVWSSLGDDPEEIKGSFYDGPTPPKGMYVVKLTRLTLKTNKNDDDMLTGLLEIAEPRKSRKQFNGYSLWMNRNVTESGERFLRNFIEKGLGIPWKLFKAKGIVTEDSETPTGVVSIAGKVKIDKQPLLVVCCKRRRVNDDLQGDWELVTDDFAPAFPGIDPKKLTDSADDDDHDDDDDDDDDMLADDDDDDVVDESEEDDDDDDDDDDEEDEEDAPTLDELGKMKTPELKALAKTAGVYEDGMKKPALVTALDEFYNGDDDDDDDDDDEDEEPPPPPAKKRRRS